MSNNEMSEEKIQNKIDLAHQLTFLESDATPIELRYFILDHAIPALEELKKAQKALQLLEATGKLNQWLSADTDNHNLEHAVCEDGFIIYLYAEKESCAVAYQADAETLADTYIQLAAQLPETIKGGE